jgi:DNA-directed RNA polymerase I subunit RPA1
LYGYRDHLREVWKNDRELFGELYPVLKTVNCENPTDIFFLEVIPVIPPKFRPMNAVNGTAVENGHTGMLKKIFEDAYMIRPILDRVNKDKEGKEQDDKIKDQYEKAASFFERAETPIDKMLSAWQALQKSVTTIVDSSKSREFNGVGFRQVSDL